MMELDFAAWKERQDSHFIEQLSLACEHHGYFGLKNHGIPSYTYELMLHEAVRLFDLDEAAKDELHIRHFANFRGYSVMKNERDWREQYHFGWDWKKFKFKDSMPRHYQLAGENPYPPSLGTSFRHTVQNYIAWANHLGAMLLEAIAHSLGQPLNLFSAKTDEPNYFLMKLICYHPLAEGPGRYGVAPHCDWSWLTIVLQDGTGGLEVQSGDGDWIPVKPQPGTLFVNLGELLEIFTNGKYIAAPHRVVSPIGQKNRISVPAFFNPPLNTMVEPMANERKHLRAMTLQKHVHRVVEKGAYTSPFLFGESEWQRKGEGKWCYDKRCI